MTVLVKQMSSRQAREQLSCSRVGGDKWAAENLVFHRQPNTEHHEYYNHS